MKKEVRYPSALTIAGSDSGGGAGIQADLKTFSAIGVYGTSVITSITAQNTQGVRKVEVLSSEIIQAQLEAVLDDIRIDAVKTGMLPTPEIIKLVSSVINHYKLKTVIIDPVMVATTGARLSAASTVDTFRKELFSRITLLTPNIPEAEALSGISITEEKDMYKAADKMMEMGCKSILIKGGHFTTTNSTDILFRMDQPPVRFSAQRIHTGNVHGTGCTFASAITAYMALGNKLEEAIEKGKKYIENAIIAGADIITGKGAGPVNHFFCPEILKPVNKK
ncbi:MAG: bifunctional hydroxymethylpyrimidine kinase/phosphomethylpyrimidine kinase [Candidatus Azobacteroides sp.]|nr:bifunctional hydroxymethylpyrimidine kinase/phosphomethylpyrimidine kinase [Candidatus Azobacteroides sp.]